MGRATFSRGGVARHQVERLKDKPNAAVADVCQGVVIERAHVLSSEVIRPEVGVSKQPSMFMRVDLPEPDGPIRAVYTPLADTSNDNPRRACTCCWSPTW